jgi:uncharacterized protein with PQ loop repeat
MDQNKDEIWAQLLIWVANIFGIIYNIPQIYHTYVTKRVDDISTLSISMRLLSSILWVFYCIYFSMWGVGVSWFITLASSILGLYYKVENCVINEALRDALRDVKAKESFPI